MRDLRRQALESGKTVSRKAQSRQSSRTSSKANSATNSRSHSRNPSRHGSDDEEGSLSDETNWRYVIRLLLIFSVCCLDFRALPSQPSVAIISCGCIVEFV